MTTSPQTEHESRNLLLFTLAVLPLLVSLILARYFMENITATLGMANMPKDRVEVMQGAILIGLALTFALALLLKKVFKM